MGAALHPPERWKIIEDLFHQCLQLPAEARAAFLDEHCGSDTELRKQIEVLLDSASTPVNLVEERIVKAAHDFVAASTGSVEVGKMIGRYEIISWLGAGGMGEVYLAQDTRLKRKVAIKVLAPALTHDERGLRRFEQEARAASALNHPNILTIFEFGHEAETHFLAAEYVEGATLRQKLARGRLEPAVAADIAAQIAKALMAAHAHGIVHRDIKPDNVMIRNDNLVKVLDFGIAKLTEAISGQAIDSALGAASLSLSQVGVVIGSAKYMSPEQARGQTVDARSDLFSLGVVLYEMIAGRVPFEGQTVSDVIAEVLKGTPPSLDSLNPNIPRQITEIADKAMGKDRVTRYQCAKDMLADLQEVQEEIRFRDKLQKAASSGTDSADGRVTTSQRNALVANSDRQAAIHDRVQRARLALIVIPIAVLVLGLGVGGFIYRKSHSPGAGAEPRSLAILPFRNLRQDPSLDYLGFSLADATITKLGYISTLIVRPSSSVDKYRNQSVDPQKVAQELSVDTLLTGGYIRDGDDFRITAQLIDIKSNRMLWQDAIDVKFDNLLTVQDRVTQEIVKGLELNLTAAEAQRLKPDNRVDPLAYEDYLRGVDL